MRAITARRTEDRPCRRLEAVVGPSPDAIPMQPSAIWPVIVGEGGINYLCHRCARVLCDGIAVGDLVGLEIRCACGAVGRVPECL